MKDLYSKGNLLLHKDTIYKDVVIIGNGPSGISLSYMLAGHWPYWSPEKAQKHPDELLRARLNYYDAQKSLVEHDLFSLADGLEGRSTNPVSLLLDSLQHPCADLGMDLPPMVEYRHHPEKEIDHLVLGRGPPGGSWHRMDPNLRTLSLAAWMSLPGLPFADWESRHPPVAAADGDEPVTSEPVPSVCARCNSELTKRAKRTGQKVALSSSSKCSKCHRSGTDGNNNTSGAGNNGMTRQQQHGDGGNVVAMLDERTGKVNVQLLCPPRRNLSLKRQVSKEVETRALISRVAQYYASYVAEMGLERYFMNETIVTTVVPLDGKCETVLPERFRHGRWIVAGFNRMTNKRFAIVCQNLVLANGASDLANRLGVKGEGLEMPWVKYELPHLERALEQYDEPGRSQLKPVLIVGAGLSAADAVTICRSSGIPVVHVYRNRTAGLDKMLPGNVYPEYHEVHKMMKDANRKHDLYTPLPEHTLVDLAGAGRVTVQHLKTGERRVLDVSYCAILIGSRPDLRFIATLTKPAAGGDGNASPDSETEDDQVAPDRCFGRPPVQPLTMWTFTEQLLTSCLGRKLYWLKHMCAKCKHINLTDKPRHHQHHKQQQQHYNAPALSAGGGHCQLGASNLSAASGLGLGEDPTKPIDCKNNPIEVDKYTNAVLRTALPGLYAMGPLVGDNFVRFIPGGALCITAALHKHTEND
ncbi:oxidative stress-induced growth inhibitor 2-like [Anopheles merus]|uniref:oxidative stress-induced growth inhibitor 2-like n=1 Tax=Anopheles merus TaxID=30066 RepID=UPI001BE41F47|nr:oxidative stress-induced growth inhibitor 2-like [Anopheles merus]XP_041782483.1 oxidative stress-induced growth inhibitor 2-like [Anopheles merus]XP_041786845.1 oxidative stress-induced growth inhibitor 2-like [Anopheles merus]